jgi:hypothetical protein
MLETQEKRNARNMPEGHSNEDGPLAIPVCHKEVAEAFGFAVVLARRRRPTTA